MRRGGKTSGNQINRTRNAPTIRNSRRLMSGNEYNWGTPALNRQTHFPAVARKRHRWPSFLHASPDPTRYNQNMSRQLEAVYEHGVLRPLEPLVLPEHQRVRLTLEEQPAKLSWESKEPTLERREELLWLAKESGPYAGEWVALDGPRLIAHGTKLADVSAAAAAAGIAEPFFARVPREKNVPFGGW